MSPQRLGVIWMLVSASAYSLFTVFGKNVLEELGTLDVLFWRFAIAAPVAWLFIYVRYRRGGAHPLSVSWKPRFIAGMTFGAMAWMAFAGLDNLPGALYIVIIYTYPAMVAVGARLLGKPLPVQVWLAVGVVLLGIAFTVPEVVSGAGGATLIGLVYTMGNAVLYAGYVLFSERLVSGGGDGLVASAWSLTGSLAVAVVIAPLSWPIDLPTSVGGVTSMIGLGVVSTVVASMAFFLGVKRLGPAPAALIASTEPVLTLVWIVLILNESLVPIQIVGAVLVITGVIWSQRAQTEMPRRQPTKA